MRMRKSLLTHLTPVVLLLLLIERKEIITNVLAIYNRVKKYDKMRKIVLKPFVMLLITMKAEKVIVVVI